MYRTNWWRKMQANFFRLLENDLRSTKEVDIISSWSDIYKTPSSPLKWTRSRTMQYHLVNSDDLKQQVCQVFFLCTLRYSTNTVLKVIFENTNPSALQLSGDKRGRHKPANKITGDDLHLIHSHINSYHPAIRHYRHAHAPNRLV